jgi:predicted SAM-dependent methyltransferase
VDIAYSFAVIQHVTDSVFIEILKQCYNKLKKGGVAIFHMPLRTKDSFPDPDTQRSEGIYGRLKWKYALNYFVRTEEEAKGLFEKTGFKSVQILDIKDICKEYFDDICSQQLIIANKL